MEKAKKAEQPSNNRKWLSEAKLCSKQFTAAIKITFFFSSGSCLSAFILIGQIQHILRKSSDQHILHYMTNINGWYLTSK